MSNLQHKLQMSVTSSSGVSSVAGYDAEAPNSEITPGTNLNFPANSVNTAFSMAFNAAKLTDVFFWASQNCTINTVGTNSTMLTLVAGIPFVWGQSMPVNGGWPSNPFTGTVNSATITCNAATQLKFLVGTS